MGPATGWLRHMPVHTTENGDDNADEPAAANGHAPAAAYEYGTAGPAPGLDSAELGHSRNSNSGINRSSQPNGGIAPRTDSTSPNAAIASPASYRSRRHDGPHTKLDQMRSKARSGKDEVRRNLEDKRARLKVSMHLYWGDLPCN